MDELLRATFARHEDLVPAAAPGLRAAIFSGARRRRAQRRWTTASGLLSGLLGAFAVVSVLIAGGAGHGSPQVAAANRPLNLLLVGIDRSGQPPAARVGADAIVLMHIDPGDRRAYAVVLPHDLRIDLAGLGRQPAQSAYLLGGYRIVADAMIRMMGLPLDGGAVADIAALESITKATGGVDLCIDERVESQHLYDNGQGPGGDLAYDQAPFVYEPGCRHYDPPEAVDYLREAVGGGDDQALYRYLKAVAASVAADPARLPAVFAAASAGLELHDSGSPTGLADALRGIDPAGVSAVELPSSTSDYGRTPLPDGDGLYAALRDGTVGPWLAAHPQYAAV